MYYNLAYRNVKRSIRDYSIYFGTLVLTVILYYIFNAFGEQVDTSVLSETTGRTIITTVRFTSVIMSSVVLIMILYANNFIISKRKKELGIYSLFGMKARNISLLLFIENFIIGLFSFGIGILFGYFLSIPIGKFLISNVLGLEEVPISFEFSYSAFIFTLIFYFLSFFLSALFNIIIINKYNLIDMIKANKKNEVSISQYKTLKLIIGFSSIILLLVGYYFAYKSTRTLEFSSNANDEETTLYLWISFISVIVSTFGLFISGLGSIFNVLSKFKSHYFNKLNSFTYRQVLNKVNTNSILLAIVTILISSSIGALTITYSGNNLFKEDLKKSVLNHGHIMLESNESLKEDYENYIINYINNNLKDNKLTDYGSYEIFQNNTGNYVFNSTKLANKMILSDMKSRFGDMVSDYEDYNIFENFIKLSDFNDFRKLNGDDIISLNNDILILKSNSYSLADEEHLQNILWDDMPNNTVDFNDNKFNINYLEYNIKIGYGRSNSVYVVPDNIYENIIKYVKSNNIQKDNDSEDLYDAPFNYLTTTSIKLQNPKDMQISSVFMSSIGDLSELDEINYYRLSHRTYAREFHNSVRSRGLLISIGFYISLILLICIGAVLSIQLINDANKSKKRFETLRKIGISENDINNSILKLVLFYFFTPTLLAILHSMFSLPFVIKIFNSKGLNIMGVLSFVSLIFILVYSIFCYLTYKNYKKIVER